MNQSHDYAGAMVSRLAGYDEEDSWQRPESTEQADTLTVIGGSLEFHGWELDSMGDDDNTVKYRRGDAVVTIRYDSPFRGTLDGHGDAGLPGSTPDPMVAAFEVAAAVADRGATVDTDDLLETMAASYYPDRIAFDFTRGNGSIETL